MSFHQFNAFSGRLKPSPQLEALSPIQPYPLQKVDPPKMMYDSIKTKVAKVLSPTNKNYSTLNPKVAEWMKKFQADLSVPTYLLRGTRDRTMMRITGTLITISFLFNMYSLYLLQKKY